MSKSWITWICPSIQPTLKILPEKQSCWLDYLLQTPLGVSGNNAKLKTWSLFGFKSWLLISSKCLWSWNLRETVFPSSFGTRLCKYRRWREGFLSTVPKILNQKAVELRGTLEPPYTEGNGQNSRDRGGKGKKEDIQKSRDSIVSFFSPSHRDRHLATTLPSSLL